MPARQYFYTPVCIEYHHIGAVNGLGQPVASTAYSPGTENPEAQGEFIMPRVDGIICLRIDLVNNRCVVSLPQDANELILPEGAISIGESDWQPRDRLEIEMDYSNNINLLAHDAVIDFTVEGE